MPWQSKFKSAPALQKTEKPTVTLKYVLRTMNHHLRKKHIILHMHMYTQTHIITIHFLVLLKTTHGLPKIHP